MSSYTFTYKNLTYILEAEYLQDAMSEVIQYWLDGEITITSLPSVFIPEEFSEQPLEDVKEKFSDHIFMLIADSLPLANILKEYLAENEKIVVTSS
jgi:hypothetical protein